MKKIRIHDYIIFRKHFKKSFTWTVFDHFLCTLRAEILAGRKFDGFDGCGETPPN